jgi:hypothetical protein
MVQERYNLLWKKPNLIYYQNIDLFLLANPSSGLYDARGKNQTMNLKVKKLWQKYFGPVVANQVSYQK